MEALTEYAYRARLRDITDMSVLVEASASPNSNELVKISSENLATVHQFDVILIEFLNNLFFIVPISDFYIPFLNTLFKFWICSFIRYRMFGGTLILLVEERARLYFNSRCNTVSIGKNYGISRIDHISICS